MNKTDIEWCDRTWNPITGCFHDCEYCYACKTTRRFRGYLHDGHLANGHCWDYFGEFKPQPGDLDYVHSWFDKNKPIFELQKPLKYKTEKGKLINAPFPFDFYPTFHHYRLARPKTIKESQTVFVGSMADCFGKWVPHEWVQDVFEACESAPWHRYLFLTKNAKRYDCLSYLLSENKKHGNWWFGASAVNQSSFDKQADNLDFYACPCNAFVSLEPLHGAIELDGLGKQGIRWVIIGAETGSSRDKVIPKREWVQDIIDACRAANVPVFLKNNLAPVVGADYVKANQSFPWEVC